MPIRAGSHRRSKLADLYQEIFKHYSSRDPELVCRRLIPEALESRVLLIAEALGEHTQRLSGIPWHFPPTEHPTLSRGGRVLDNFLAGFGYTIQLGGRGQYAYHTELAYYFPGRKARGTRDLPPAAEEIALNVRWLEREIRLLEPVAVVTLGLPASRNFLERYAGWSINKLKDIKLEDIAGIPGSCSILGRQVDTIAVYHPSRGQRTSKEVYRRAARHIRRILAKTE